MTINWRKTSTGNWVGRSGSYYITVYKRPHCAWCARVGKSGEWLYSEGYHGTYLNGIAKAKQWCKDKLNSL